MTRIAFRATDELAQQLEQLAIARGHKTSTVIRDALRHYMDRERQLDHIESLEARMVASMERLAKNDRILRNDLHVLMGMVHTLVRTYLLHTPPIPPEAVEAAAASARDREAKFMKMVVASVQGGGPDVLADLDAAANE